MKKPVDKNVVPKRILFLGVGMDMGGIARAFTTLASALEKRGYEICVVARYESDIRKLAIPRRYVVGAAWKRRIQNRWIATGLRVIFWIVGWKWYFFFAKKFEHDIYVNFPGNNVPEWQWYSDKPSILWLHGRDILRLTSVLGRLLKYRTSEACARAMSLVAITDSVSDYWRKTFDLSRNPVVISNVHGVEEIINKSCETQSEIIKSEVPNIICVARLSREKGILRLLQVASRLKLDNLNCKIYIIGGGTKIAREIDSVVSKNDLCGMVKFLGEKTNPYPYIKAADLLICPSVHEGLALVLGEALVLNCPACATDCGGPRTALRDGAWGVLLDNSEDGIYDGLKNFIKDHKAFLPRIPFEEIRKELMVTETLAVEKIVMLLKQVARE